MKISLFSGILLISLTAQADVTLQQLQEKMDQCSFQFLKNFCKMEKEKNFGPDKPEDYWNCEKGAYSPQDGSISVEDRHHTLGFDKKVIAPHAKFSPTWQGPQVVGESGFDTTAYPEFAFFDGCLLSNFNKPDFAGEPDVGKMLTGNACLRAGDTIYPFPSLSFHKRDLKTHDNLGESVVSKYKIVPTTRVKGDVRILEDGEDYSVKPLIEDFEACLKR